MTEVVTRILNKNIERWTPTVNGPFFSKYKEEKLSRLSDQDINNFVDDTTDILSQTINPKNFEENLRLKSSGLVIGFIQSGKTSSMEGLITMARDNGYKLIILMSGIVGNLTSQTIERIEQTIIGPGWQKITIPGVRDGAFNIEDKALEISNNFSSWEDEEDELRRSTTIILTMKNKSRLTKLTDLLKIINENYDLKNVPTLIIDDEADQASPTTIRNRSQNGTTYVVKANETKHDICEKFSIELDELAEYNNEELDFEVRPGDEVLIERPETATHRSIKRLRQILSFHSYLSYTATPQGLFLVNLVNFLSPKFVSIIRPGQLYTGGKFFFGSPESTERYTEVIPNSEINDFENPENPPETLLKAFQYYLVGVAVGFYNKEDYETQKYNRTFMISPHHLNVEHGKYRDCIVQSMNVWKQILKDKNNPDRKLLLEEFELQYGELKKVSVSDLPIFSDLENDLVRAINNLKIEVVNSVGGAIQAINWDESYARVLIGGRGLERGYTVEGLTVTFMSRPSGGGRARSSGGQSDTLQQRGRFFGYRRSYKDFIKIFLTSDLLRFYQDYVDTEESLHQSLKQHIEEGKPISKWPRHFILDSRIRITRSNIISFTLKNVKPMNVKQRHSHDLNDDQIENLRSTYDNLLNLKFTRLIDINVHQDWKERRPNDRLIEVFNLKDALDKLLVDIDQHENDNLQYVSALSLIKLFIDKEKENKNLPFKIIMMNVDEKIQENNRRTITSEDTRSVQIFGGRDREGPYPGDQYIHYDYIVGNTDYDIPSDHPTLMVYRFSRILDTNGEIISKDVPYFCLKLPDSITKNVQTFT